MIDLMYEVLTSVISDTITSGSPEPARRYARELVERDERAEISQSDPPPGQTVALIMLCQWLAAWTPEDGGRPDPDQVLEWIAEHIGPRYRARARYLIALLGDDSQRASEAIELYADALRDDFLPAVVWIASALTALHGPPDRAWIAG